MDQNLSTNNNKDKNICIFTNDNYTENDLFAFQFIYETAPEHLENPRTYPGFCCYLMVHGSAWLDTEYGNFSLQQGCLFVTFPASPFSIHHCDQAKYLYIAFVGKQATEFLESVGITRTNPVCYGYEELKSTWLYGIDKTTPGNLSILTKGILFYTISIISSNQNPVLQRADVNIVEQIRTDIECMYANSELSLVSLCSRYKYNHKYVSRKFSEEIGVTFTEYLQTCRLQHAYHLLRETNRTVYDIAIGVGFRDAMYFSRVFKKSTGMTPLQYRHMHKE